MTQAIEIIKREPLADRLGFHDLMPSQITAWRRDLLDALSAEKVCPKCPGVKGCPWQGIRPSAYLEGNGLSASLVVRYGRCGSAEELHAETAQKRRWGMARIPEKFRDASLENFRTQGTHQDCRKLKAKVLEALHDGHSLVLASKTKGNGKTHLAVAFARERLKAGKAVLFWTVKDLLDEAKKSFDDTVWIS